MTVVETGDRAAAVEALQKRAEGGSWKDVGLLLAKHRVPMPGTQGGGGRTFADYSSVSARTAGAKTIILNHLDYYRTGEWDELRTVALPHTQIRGIPLEHDPHTGRRYTTVRVTGMPWRPMLTDAEWAAFDAQETADGAARKTGAAARHAVADERVSAFMGVSTWIDDELQLTLMPDSATAYRLRSRPPEDRGWENGEGRIEATLRRTLFQAGCGRSLLAALRGIEHLLARPQRRVAHNDPIAVLQRHVADLEGRLAATNKASQVADRELEAAERDDKEAAHWRSKGKEARKDLRILKASLADAQAELASAVDSLVESVEAAAADIAEPVLLASLLLDGTKKVPPVVAELLDAYGITRSLRLSRPDPATGAVRATATARLPLLDGSTFDVHLEWDTPNSRNATGDAALVPAMIRLWADGHSFEEIAEHFPDHDSKRIKKRLNEALKRGGMTCRGLRIAALKCPVAATRQVGLPTTTLRDLATAGTVPSVTTISGHRRFDIDALTEALRPLGLLGSPENPIVAIGQLAKHPEVRSRQGSYGDWPMSGRSRPLAAPAASVGSASRMSSTPSTRPAKLRRRRSRRSLSSRWRGRLGRGRQPQWRWRRQRAPTAR